MIPMRAFRADPHFADLFAPVCVICWPILCRQLNALLVWSRRQSVVHLLYSVNDWSFNTLRRAGEATHPVTSKPLARTFRPLTDTRLGSDVPSDLDARSRSETACSALILLASAGELVSCAAGCLRGGALYSHPNISSLIFRSCRLSTG